ncbi:DUF2807 domain-containing protein [Muricauda sp. SCSIO 64092]|uniref:GIN domain-containing protein n=1 Tax=Allomuricauda sp. SCSIO 64092 TaxID=2908842 RepID=UPI001FF616EF|nr:DUF2807 domain-containing protein [Muricauda sp. SCSIO 64092]UOY07853.1 DUF2807 domain-containing protein [Muricauda sp. SCSIO 64092]
MKRFISIFFLVMPLLLISQRQPKIKGNRSVTEVSEQLPAFTAIELSHNLDIKLKKSFGEGYEIIADDNLVDVLKFDVVDSTLVISSFYDIVSKKKLEITVNYRELMAITVKEGKVFSNEVISSDELYLNTFGNAELDIEASGFMANVNAEDNSTMNLNLDIDSLNVSMKHKTDGVIYAVSGAKNINLEDSTSLTLEGTTESLRAEMKTNTKLKADKLEAAEVDLTIKESGFARINAYRTFTLKSSGNAKTHLYGNPKVAVEEFLDTSQLLKKGD